jgi:hypothetical protein
MDGAAHTEASPSCEYIEPGERGRRNAEPLPVQTQIILRVAKFAAKGRSVHPVQMEVAMLDMKTQLEKLRIDAEDCALISRLSTEPRKAELFGRLADHLAALATEVERAMADKSPAAR